MSDLRKLIQKQGLPGAGQTAPGKDYNTLWRAWKKEKCGKIFLTTLRRTNRDWFLPWIWAS
ncbi:MAG TPA: hypothetical protein VEF34_02330 [Syntrophobacteraceae bacterium]|nr:hypothetical protein [Syntrophobacteraceae bacterium]